MSTYSDHTTQVMAMMWKVTEHMIFRLSLAVIWSFSHCGWRMLEEVNQYTSTNALLMYAVM